MRVVVVLLLLLLLLLSCFSNRVAVFHRLYQQAIALRQKLDFKRDETKRQEVESINANRTSMSWISSEMMRDRSSGPFDNYGEMLYAESLEALARKRDKVGNRQVNTVVSTSRCNMLLDLYEAVSVSCALSG